MPIFCADYVDSCMVKFGKPNQSILMWGNLLVTNTLYSVNSVIPASAFKNPPYSGKF